MSNQVARSLLIIATVASSWLGMQIVHEGGHIAAAWLTGGTVTDVALHPLSISRTDVNPNPHPSIVVWSGPIIGTLLPLVGCALAYRLRLSSAYLYRFFAGFCCVANGAYIGAGVLFPVGDARLMRAAGAPAWVLGLFGVVSLTCGLWLWNGLGPRFGLGPHSDPVNRRHMACMLSMCVGIVIVELALL